MTETTSPSEPGGSAARTAFGAGFAAVWVFSFLILRIFAVSGYDWETAFLVSTTLSLDDGVSILFGSLMAGRALTAGLVVWVVPLLLAASIWGSRGHRAVLMLMTALGIALVVALTVSLRSWWLAPACAVLFGMLVLARRLSARNLFRRATTAVIGSIRWLIPVAVLVVAALIQTPWIPQEHIATTKGPVTGYVLSVDSGYLNVLTDEHEFVILLTGDVLSRD